MPRPQTIRNFDEALKVLGGPAAVGRLTGQPASGVCNWKRGERAEFPPKYYLIIWDALEEKGYHASPNLFGFVHVCRKAA